MSENNADLPEPTITPEDETRVGSSSPLTAVTIGPYRVVRKIGEGGMGEVYEAEQEKPLRRRVALKIIKWGMDTKEVIARFESERQALALMTHSNIARVLDAGATDQGRPYFAMEHVQGIPITEYCDRHRLTIPERLDLFIHLCAGVQHAHQKGIIHRDIKPSNVLVTVQDDKPVPKIIDFGVAKATSLRLTEWTVYTEFGQLIGTPEYMSPEQAEMSGLEVDTRSDIYSLGAVLYELLTGSAPFNPKELRSAGLVEIHRRLREEEPARPSTCIESLGTNAAQPASKRRTEARALARQLRGDLDWLTMKAMDKDRTRRYSSAAELAQDVRRHLQHEPVLASPPTLVYRMQKFVKRHPVGVSSAAAFFVVLVAFAATTAWQAVRLARERDRAEIEAQKAIAVTEFLEETLGSADPLSSKGRREITVVEALASAEKKAEDELSEQPAIQAAVLATIGQTYMGLGRYTEADRLFKEALDTRRRVLGQEHPDVVESLTHLGQLSYLEGDFQAAEHNLGEALEMARKVFGGDDEKVSYIQNDLALTIARGRADFKTAEGLFRESLAIRRKLRGEEHTDVAEGLNNLALLYNQMRNFDAAEPLFRQALAIQKAINEEHIGVPTVLGNLGDMLREKGDYDQAEALHREALELVRKLLGEDHPTVASYLSNLAATLGFKGDAAQAVTLLRDALERQRKILPEENVDIALTKGRLGRHLSLLGRYGEAEPLMLEAYDVFKDLGEDHPGTQEAVSQIIRMYESWGQIEKAQQFRELLSPTNPAR